MRLDKLRKFIKSQGETLLRAEIALGGAILFAVYFYNYSPSWDHGQLLDLRLAITLVIVEVPLFMFTPILYRAIINESVAHAEVQKRLQDSEIHKKQLVEKIYKKLTTIQLYFVKDKAILQVERFEKWEPWHKDVEPENLYLSIDKLKESEYPYFDYALEHLKEYDFCVFWNHTKLLVDVINSGSRPSELENNKNIIQEALRQFRIELTKLTARLEAGESLKGSCPLGY